MVQGLESLGRSLGFGLFGWGEGCRTWEGIG